MITGCGVPKEPSIMRMDWKSLGYERDYRDGRLTWVPTETYKSEDNFKSET